MHGTIPNARQADRSKRSDAEFPKTLAAARKLEGAHWALGDALIEECGPPGDDGVRTGSDEKLRRAAKVLKANGFDYSFEHLRDLRRTADAFRAVERSTAVLWSVHSVARNLTTLKDAAAQAKRENKNLTVEYLREFKRRRKNQGLISVVNATAKQDVLTAAADALELAEGVRRRLDMIKQLSATERSKLFAAITKVAQAWSAIAAGVQPTVELQEAAE
jgi:hypothetical protein